METPFRGLGLAAVVALGVAALAPGAQAAVVLINPTTSPLGGSAPTAAAGVTYTATDTGGNAINATYIIHGTATGGGDFNPQNIDAIRSDINTAMTTLGIGLSLTAANDLAHCDSGGCDGNPPGVSATGFGADGGEVSSTQTPFHYAAIHYGQSELVFYFASAIRSLAFDNLPNGSKGGGGFSNVNIYTPIPGAALLFGSALAGLAWVRRRRGGEAAAPA
ncbi:MAG: hypothetical protein U1E14_21155 [Geminicoccaceae bacterium]